MATFQKNGPVERMRGTEITLWEHMVNSACKHLAIKLTWWGRSVIPIKRICIGKHSAVNAVLYTPCSWCPPSEHGSNNSHGRTQT